MKNKTSGTLYLVPNFINQESTKEAFPDINRQILSGLKLLIVENAKNARSLLKRMGILPPYDSIEFIELKRTDEEEQIGLILQILKGKNAALISDAGYPCIADPGEKLVELAQQNNVRVKPLVGPSSILLALAASGLNAENFCFHGYLPIKSFQRQKKLAELDSQLRKTGYSQIFMETPYRGDQMLSELLKSCRKDSRLCLAMELHSPQEMILTKSIDEWMKIKISLNKKMTIFILGTLITNDL